MNSVWVALAVVMAIGFGFGLGYAVTRFAPQPPVVVQCPAAPQVAQPLRTLAFEDTMDVLAAGIQAGKHAVRPPVAWEAPERPWTRPMNGAELDRFALVPEPNGHPSGGERGMQP